jgi:uncharacterized membrane protein YkvA (DUF1232 family)
LKFQKNQIHGKTESTAQQWRNIMSEMLPPQEQVENTEKSGFVKALSEPLSKYGWPSWLVYLLAVLGLIYILNPTLGILEFIPDNLPIIGNLDESVAVMLVLAGVIEALEGKKHRKKTLDKHPEKPDNPSA